jgi:hypothetical protein
VLGRIAEFLGVSPFPPIARKSAHARDYDTAMTPEEKNYLVDIFAPDIRELETLLGWDCSVWLA